MPHASFGMILGEIAGFVKKNHHVKKDAGQASMTDRERLKDSYMEWLF